MAFAEFSYIKLKRSGRVKNDLKDNKSIRLKFKNIYKLAPS